MCDLPQRLTQPPNFYAYDADGSRIKEVAGSKTTRTFFPFYVEEKVGSTTTVIKYYTFNGMTIAMKRGSDLRYLHTDHLGSNSVVTNADGTLHSGQNYCAYGGQRIATWYGFECDPTAVNPLPTDRTFTGQEQDGSGLIYFQARFMDPALGMFLSPDTVVPEPGTVADYNRFAYTRNNPLRYADPTGHCATNTDGSRSESDADCWQLADIIYATWDGQDWQQHFGNIDREYFMATLAPMAALDARWMQTQLDYMWTNFYGRVGLADSQYNPIPVRELGEYQEAPGHMPGEKMAKTLIVDIVQCSQSLLDCGNALDDLSTSLAATAMGCAVTGFEPCAGSAAVAASIAGTVGTLLTGANFSLGNGKASLADGGVSIATTTIGWTKYATKRNRSVGFVVSAIQWLWDHRSGGRQ